MPTVNKSCDEEEWPHVCEYGSICRGCWQWLVEIGLVDR